MVDVFRLAQVQFGVALTVVLVLVAALAWRNVFGRAPAPDLKLPKWWRTPELSAVWRRRARSSLDGALALAALSLAALSITAATPSGAGVDQRVVLHELVQAKYHRELGWDGLYACAWAADFDAERAIRGVEKLRVLELEPPPELEPSPVPERDERGHKPRARPTPPPAGVGGKLLPARATQTRFDCRERFDDERWAALGADVAALVGFNPEQSLADPMEGFGSTATPARLARQRIVFSILPISAGSLFMLSLFAGFLAIGALVLVERAWGLRVAALVGIAIFVEFAASPIAGGATPSGALVIAAVLAGLAAFELERQVLAGALLGFAAVELVWPTLLVLGLLAKLGVEALDGHPRKRELTRLALGVGASAAGFLLLSASLPGGLGNWATWADRVALVRYADGSRQVGLQWLFAPEGNLLSAPNWVPYPTKAQHIFDRRGWILVCATLLLAPSLLALRRLPAVAFAAIAGVTAGFCFFSLEARSYGVALPLLVLAAGVIGKQHEDSRLLIGRPTTVLVAGCLALSVGMHGIVRLHAYEPFLFNIVYSHLLTTLLLGLAVALVLLPDLREHGDPPGAPAAIPVLEAASAAAPRFPLLARLRDRSRAEGEKGGRS
ncbi:MAG: hypothetical protein R6X02_32170 [Enhygromyxa sp.]